MNKLKKLLFLGLCVMLMTMLVACQQQKTADTSAQPANSSAATENKQTDDTSKWNDGSEKVVSEAVKARPEAILEGSAFKSNKARHLYGTLSNSSGLRETINFLTDFEKMPNNYKYIIFAVKNNDQKYPLMFRINQYRVQGVKPGETKQLTIELKDKVDKNYLFNIGQDAGETNATYVVYSTNELPG